MNYLREIISLNARWYEFLEEQDGATIEAIISGASRLSAHRAESDHRASRESVAGPVPPTRPSRDPAQAAHDLAELASEDERRGYLRTAEPSVKNMRETAKLCGLNRYSKLNRTELVELLATCDSGEVDGPVSRREVSYRPTGAESEQPATARESRRSSSAPPTGTAQPSVDAAAIAARLRDISTEEDGAAHLDAQRLDRENLLAVAAELKLTRVDRLSRAELRRRVLKQAIGARRKFAGLRNW